ncbi:hypothetical protein QTO34_010079 [Cnephaeus nilssonii]|uniref:Peptidase S1 domain-containing protein n=1 Tax=Cnephaeus nilssonii TaxID=3371016 RepID=A0AA40LDX4_CNENI|nr:hypothetical protein QTO34_010079 [Eptesicus nilssonii]
MSLFPLARVQDCVLAGSRLEKHGVCGTSLLGDSGSPLICEGSLQGLVSSGFYPCTPPLEPVIYTRLCMYRKWISDTMKNNS